MHASKEEVQVLLAAGWKKSFFENEKGERLWHPPGLPGKQYLVPESRAVKNRAKIEAFAASKANGEGGDD